MKRKGLLLLLVAACLLPSFQSNSTLPYELTGDKQLLLPEANVYRNWPFICNAVIPNDRNQGKAIFPGIHTVYISPDAFERRREKGAYPDGTMVLMEVAHMAFRESEGGMGYFNTGGMDVLVQIKDRRRFEGSGWGYYFFKDKDLKAGKKTAALQPAASCQSCHQVAAGEDELFTQYYPKLAPKP